MLSRMHCTDSQPSELNFQANVVKGYNASMLNCLQALLTVTLHITYKSKIIN